MWRRIDRQSKYRKTNPLRDRDQFCVLVEIEKVT